MCNYDINIIFHMFKSKLPENWASQKQQNIKQWKRKLRHKNDFQPDILAPFSKIL
jgi:hypothetical protein